MRKKTKILATIGPASQSEEVIERLALAGVNAFRLNFSHGSHEYHKETIEKIRRVEAKIGHRIGIFQDICGPKIRVGKLKEPFRLKVGDAIEVHKEEILGEKNGEHSYKISINQPQILPLLKEGEYIYLCDGSIRAKIECSGENVVLARIENDGILNSNKGVNFPNTKINIDVITPKDFEDMKFGAASGVNFVAISFVQNANDVIKAREILQSFGSRAKIYAKIEKFDAVENIDEIIEASDGIMVARGDLGIEVPYYKVPTIQKLIIKKANEASKPVITATQMMLSMAEHETATRAEISDVANAVLDGTDAVMLSEESAIGKNPVAVVQAMRNTIVQTQQIYPFNKFDKFERYDDIDVVAASSARLAVQLDHELGQIGAQDGQIPREQGHHRYHARRGDRTSADARLGRDAGLCAGQRRPRLARSKLDPQGRRARLCGSRQVLHHDGGLPRGSGGQHELHPHFKTRAD